MPTIYLATSGCYSDYAIEAAFSTEAAAEEFCRFHNKNPDEEEDGYGYRVEPVELDHWNRPTVPIGRYPFEVEITRDGNIKDIEQISLAVATKAVEPDQYSHEFVTNEIIFTATNEGVQYAVMQMWARDKNHAVKIAGERRTRLLALNQWVVVGTSKYGGYDYIEKPYDVVDDGCLEETK